MIKNLYTNEPVYEKYTGHPLELHNGSTDT